VIRINLLGGDRHATVAPSDDSTRRVAIGGALILLVTVVGIGWWYTSLVQTGAALDQEIATAQQEVQRLQSVLAEVQEIEARRADVQRRVGLIEQLRNGQSVPVRLLDHVSRSLPELLWLDQLVQQNDTVTISGFSTTLIALSDFVGNLGTGDLLERPIELVDSQVQTAPGAAAADGLEIIRFTVRARMATSAAAPEMAAAGPAGVTP
jgi:type IV pilus assembly protein PilN